MLIAKDPEKLQKMLISKIINENWKFSSKYGTELRGRPQLVISENPASDFEPDSSGWKACGETYSERVEECISDAIEKLKKVPYTRRVSIPVWRPKDHLCDTPPAITEISLLYADDRLHATAFFRSLDAVNYFTPNFSFVSHVLEEVSRNAGFEAGSVAMLISIPHIYERDVDRVSKEQYTEILGFHKLGTHIVEDYLSSAWHSALETIYYHGDSKRTEWGELFEGQEESKYIHRMFIEVKDPEENQIHDKAPFTKKYGVEYAHDYVIHAGAIDREVKENILKEGETYTYAERARYCEKDEISVDQLYTVIQKLKERKSRRDCYIGISRPWDITSDEPPCLRGYQFGVNETFFGLFYMRSNDAYGAMHANMFAFNLLTRYLAEMCGFSTHRYYHFALDAHIYGEFVESVREILEPETPGYIDMIEKR
ncbi:thymidylate synthase [Geoglobus acetivorans]|uniref:Thymidylate synthase n=1 Tax=Geoglobus acetivorans TaxID=565033 RepID=A0ABZ3H3F2_GEOAI|nr:thymidylate synthase [Geoglobus acetivorans]